MVVAVCCARKPRSAPSMQCPWVWMAATWCFVRILLLASVEDGLNGYSFAGPLAFILPPAYACLLAGTAGLLLLKIRTARTLALMIAAIELALVWYDSYFGWLLVHFATGGHAWTRNAFHAICVRSVESVGPWLLIAVYAWRVPMTRLPDDDSPYPRRYCAVCGYNLHGLAESRCPECATQFATGRVVQPADQLRCEGGKSGSRRFRGCPSARRPVSHPSLTCRPNGRWP